MDYALELTVLQDGMYTANRCLTNGGSYEKKDYEGPGDVHIAARGRTA